MTNVTQTFGLYNDEAGTDLFSGFYDLEHNTDESDNPQDKTLWLLSNTTLRKIQAASDPGVDNIVFTITDILDSWAAATTYAVGDCVEPTTPDNFRYKCTAITTGLSHSTIEPIWSGMGGLGSTIVDNGVTWTKISAKHQTTEFTLSLDEAGLDVNTPGQALSLGNTIESDDGPVAIWIRIINEVNNVSNNTATPEVALRFNALRETEVTS